MISNKTMMKKILLFSILFSSISLWSKSLMGTYDCLKIDSSDKKSEHATVTIDSPVKKGNIIYFNSYPMIITNLWSNGGFRASGENSKDAYFDLYQISSSLWLFTWDIQRKKYRRTDFKCKFSK